MRSSENKGADQLRGSQSAPLFSHIMQIVGFLMWELILTFEHLNCDAC